MKKILFVAAASMLGSALYAQAQPPEPAPTPDAVATPAETPDATPSADAMAPDPAQPATTEPAPPSDTSSAATTDEHKGKHKKKPHGM
jgi:hypothetical protein